MERQTTTETLARMRDHIEKFDSEAWGSEVTAEGLWRDYESYKYVAMTLNMPELRLIYLLRGCRAGELQRFLTAAQKLYDAYRFAESLSDTAII